MRFSEVSAVHGLNGRRDYLKATYGGKMLAALYRQRRAPSQALRAAWARRGQARACSSASSCGEYRGIYLLPAGQGAWPALRDTIESILHWDGDDTKIVVIDDATVDCREAVVRTHFPEVQVLRRAWPNGGPPRQFPMLAAAIRTVLQQYRFDVICKLDTDALLTGPGLTAHVADTFAESPRVGMLGTIGLRADGVPEDYTYDRWALSHSRRWSARVRRLAERARIGGYSGKKVHGGLYFLSRRSVTAADREGLLEWPQPWWSVLSEDHCFTLALHASGSRLGSLGGPAEPTVSGQSYLPIDKEEVVRLKKLAVHSVRRGNRGENETELRRFFRAHRESSAPDASRRPPRGARDL